MIDQRLLTARILHFALMGSLGMYTLVLFQLKIAPHAIEPVMLYALGAAALMVMAAIPILRSRLMPPRSEPHSLDDQVSDAAMLAALPKLFTVWILSWALCEAIGIFGFVLSFLSGDLKYFAVFAGVSLLNFLIYRPTREQVLSVARAAV